MKRPMILIAPVVGALLSLTLAACGDDDLAPAPTVALAEVIRGDFALEREGHVTKVRGPERVEEASTVRTGADGRGFLSLDSGAWVLLDRDSALVPSLEGLTLSGGRAWVDAGSADAITVDTGAGEVRATGATFAVEKAEGGARIYCGSGEVTYQSDEGEGRLAQGETLVLGDGAPRVETPLWDDWTGGLADPTRDAEIGPSHIGVLRGRRLDQLGQARTPLPIRGHEVNAVLRGDLAETTVVQTFFNARSDILEAEYAVRIPEGAVVQGFEVDTGGGFVSSVALPMQTTDGYGINWGSPTLASSRLSWDGPGRLRARINPVSPGATVRVKLRYTEWMDRRGAMRTWVYPMQTSEGAPQIGEFVLEVDASGAQARAYRAGMGATVSGGHIVLRRSDFRPHADFYLDLVDAEPPKSDQAKLYLANAAASDDPLEEDERYVLVDVPTEGIADSDDETAEHPLELVIVVDVSGATDDEDLELSQSIVEGVLRQLAPTDRVTLRLGDVRARVPEGIPAEPAEATPETREALTDALAHADLGGATDLATVLREAARAVAGRPRGAVLYLGDAIPTTGPLDASAIGEVLASVDAPPRFFGLAVGDGANLGLLRALFGEESQLVAERTEASRAVMGILAEAARPTLRGVSVAMGEGIERVYPRPPITVADRSHIRFVGRLVGEVPTRITLSGSRDGEAFSKSYQVGQRDIVDGGDIAKRWANERLRQLMDESAGREALVELGMRFSLLSPWTSLVVGGSYGTTYVPIEGFDHDPMRHPFWLGGGGGGLTIDSLEGQSGWRRRARTEVEPPVTAPEETWVRRVSADDEDASASGDGGLAEAAVGRALSLGTRGPRGCYERKLTVRPDLSGDVTVEVRVDGEGKVGEARVVGSTLSAADVDDCILTEVRGIRFPATGASTAVQVTHVYTFAMPSRAFGERRQCSDASYQELEVRRQLWHERLASSAGVSGALQVYREASRWCELRGWRARRTLLSMMLQSVGGVAQQVQLYRAFGADSSVAGYLRRAILRHVRTPADVMAVRAGLGLDVPVDWRVFSRLWKANHDPEARLRLVRTWLEVVPDEMDLRLRLLALLEETGKLPEARRLARELRAWPLADARVRTQVGEFWLRQDDVEEARRVFSEIVENAPLDPWARRRLGDLYRSHGWYDDAYREYQTLARLRPDEDSVLLDLARAAAGAGRIDEALRLEQRLSETADADAKDGVAELARLWTEVRFARLKSEELDEATAAALRRRIRQSGALREPPAIFVALTWPHPDDRPELFLHFPESAITSEREDGYWEPAEVTGTLQGISASHIRELEGGDYLLEVRREEEDELRDLEAQLLVVVAPATPEERILRADVRLSREARKARFALNGDTLQTTTVSD